MTKNVTLSLGLLLFAIGLFFVPVSFSVKGFGMIVSPDGVRSIRTLSGGTLYQADPAPGGYFAPGDSGRMDHLDVGRRRNGERGLRLTAHRWRS